MSQRLLPYLDVRGPNNQVFKVSLDKDRLTIGRFAEFNDIALIEDPQQLISRKVHCAIERQAGGWWVVDNGSVNRTFLQRNGEMEVVTGRALILTGDQICLLGQLTEEGTPLYWRLTFEDPFATQALSIVLQPLLEYDWVQAKLFQIEGSDREEIKNLRPKEHKLVRYMDQRNRANGNVPVMCSYEELLEAIWGDEVGHTESEVNHLVWGLRKKIEPDPKNPRFLELVSGLGYRFNTSG
ncbi:MAG: winged helix-turn-helix domain-containing protein [Chloroflexota bacterium]